MVLSTYDAICSFVGSGVFQEGEASDVSGTVTVFRAASAKRIDSIGNKIQQLPYHEGKIHIIGGSNNMGGGLIEWVKQCYYQNEMLPYELMEKMRVRHLWVQGALYFCHIFWESARLCGTAMPEVCSLDWRGCTQGKK